MDKDMKKCCTQPKNIKQFKVGFIIYRFCWKSNVEKKEKQIFTVAGVLAVDVSQMLLCIEFLLSIQ